MVQGVNVTTRSLERARRVLDHELVRDVVLPFVFLRTAVLVIGLAAMRILPNARGFHARAVPFVDAMIRWDAIYYLEVARNGYGGEADAFFPMYPALARAVALVMPLSYAAVVVAHVAALTALVLLHRLVRAEDGRFVARRAVMLALLFPTSFFLVSAYAESTYLAFLLGAFVADRERRPWTAAVCAAAACLARPQGFLCATLPFVVQFVAARPRPTSIRGAPFFVAASVVSLGALLLMHQVASGDPLGFLHSRTVQSLGVFHETRHAAAPPFYLVLWDEGFGPNLGRRVLNWSALALVGVAAVALVRRGRVAAGTLCVVSMLVPLYFHGTLFDAASMARYALLAFPIFPWLASQRVGADGRRLLDVSFAMTQVVLFMAYTGWYWAE